MKVVLDDDGLSIPGDDEPLDDTPAGDGTKKDDMLGDLMKEFDEPKTVTEKEKTTEQQTQTKEKPQAEDSGENIEVYKNTYSFDFCL